MEDLIHLNDVLSKKVIRSFSQFINLMKEWNGNYDFIYKDQYGVTVRENDILLCNYKGEEVETISVNSEYFTVPFLIVYTSYSVENISGVFYKICFTIVECSDIPEF
jgi:hypothetical protein